MAKDGDKTMIKLFLQRLLPELKAEGGSASKNQVVGIHIVVNQTDTGPKDVSEAVTINQIDTPEEDDDNDGTEEEG